MHCERIYLLILTWKLVLGAKEPLHYLSNDFIDSINKEGKWTAGNNFPPDTPVERINQLGSARVNIADVQKLPVLNYAADVIVDLPESFDPREKWSNCPSLNEIRDQGQCGACWAFGAVQVMTDRVCILSNGTKNFHFSAEDVISCNSDDSGCSGGDPTVPWEQWVQTGLVSGGNYNSHEGCKPYSFAPCPNHMKNCTHWKPTPPCLHSCEDGYKTSYEKDKKRGKKIYRVSGEENIMAELYTNGPVEAFFVVFEDFADYKGGVYQHVKGDVVFGHAVKMMGWGVEGGTKYWLAANSWGPSFGENGFFKIIRGVNECSIEELVLAGEPLMENY